LKRIFTVLLIAFICLCHVSFIAPPAANDEAFHKKVFGYIETQHDSLFRELTLLHALIQTEQFDSAKKIFLDCRLRYKKTEAFVTYFYPGDARFINGRNEQEIEDDDEPDFIIYPHGFQVIESALYDAEPVSHKLQLLNETDSVADLLKRCTAAIQTMQITPRIFFEAMQMQLIRLYMITAVNLETPESHHAAPEIISSMNAMKDLVYKAFNFEFSGRSMVLHVFCETLDAASQYLDAYPSIEQVDYFKLYAKFYIPLSDQLRTARGNLVEENYQSTTAIDLNAASVFDQSAFNTFFFNPTQTKTGSPERAALGRILFFDPVLSVNNRRACASCHQPAKAFTDGLPKSISMDGKSTVSRNAPTLINAAVQGRLFHDARTMNLEDQADEVLKNPLEMHHDLSSSIKELKTSPEYVVLFKEAFKGTPDTFISTHAVLLAIAEYERTLVSFNSRFDKTMRGEESSLSADEHEGFRLFITKGNCASCHFIPLFSGTMPPEYKVSDWEVIGTPRVNDRLKAELDPDAGRGGVHRTSLYRHAFKTPGLRNVALTAPYMHNGVFNTLEEVMDFYNSGGGKGWGIEVPNQTLPSDSLRLTRDERNKIIAFLKSLTDTAGLTSPPVSLPHFPNDAALNARVMGGAY
jgi:cytochrome c peroxidase